jgi:hypothetical protein
MTAAQTATDGNDMMLKVPGAKDKLVEVGPPPKRLFIFTFCCPQ